MASSKIKSEKQKVRLKARIDAWEKIPDKAGKSGKLKFRKPGSLRK